jgi:Holliday junction DNA helicase RuvA
VIGFLRGIVAQRDRESLTLDVGGVGFVIHVPSSVAEAATMGAEACFHTHLHVREAELTLYGFDDQVARTMFCDLISVSGVGPKVALAALSSYTPAALALAVSIDDIVTLSSIPGVGKKTAQRIALDLKGKVAADRGGFEASFGAARAPALSDAHAALDAMGFSAAEIAVALSGVDLDMDTPSLMREALRRLGGARA